MKNQMFLVCAVLCAAFIAAPAVAAPPTPKELCAKTDAELLECREDRAECAEALEKCEETKAASAAVAPAPAAKAPVKEKIITCLFPDPAAPIRGNCECPEGMSAVPTAPPNGRAKEFKWYYFAYVTCAWSDPELRNRIAAVEAKINLHLENHPSGISDELHKEIERLIIDFPEGEKKRITDRLRAVEEGLKKTCSKERPENCPAPPEGLEHKFELTLGPMVGVTSRFADGQTSTLVLGGEAGATAWVSDSVGIRGTFGLGYGVTPNEPHTVTRATLGPAFALDDERDHTLTPFVGGLSELGPQAVNVSGVDGGVSYQGRFGDWFYLRPSVSLGAFRENPFIDGTRQEVSGFGLGMTGFLSLGGYIGGAAPTASSTTD